MRQRRVFLSAGAVAGLVIVLGSCEQSSLEPVSGGELRLQLLASDSVIEDGDSIVLSAKVVAEKGIPVDPEAFSFKWSVDDGELAEIGGQGSSVTLRALSPGETELQVEVEPRSAAYRQGNLLGRFRFRFRPRPHRIEVVSGADQAGPLGSPLPDPVTVRLLDRRGKPLPGREIQFVPDSGGSVTPASVKTDPDGTASSSWRLGPRAGERALVVRSARVPDLSVNAMATHPDSSLPVAKVVLTPDKIRWHAIGDRMTVSATAFDSVGRPVSDVRFRWRTSDANIATVDTMGRVTAQGIGSALIIASAVCCAKADTTGVDVSQRVQSIMLSPDQLSLAVGASATLSVVARDANQNAVESPSVNWSSSNTSVATVSGGRVTGVSTGSAYIRASSGDGQDSARVTVLSGSNPPSAGLENECATPRAGWIWCDDFGQDRLASYFEYDNAGGAFVRENNIGLGGSSGMRATFERGQADVGALRLAFGRTPAAYFKPVDGGQNIHRDVYWRIFVRNESNWTGGGGNKFSRAIVFANSNWAEAAIGHVWAGGQDNTRLVIDPASGTDEQGNLRTTRYNDFDQLRWLGSRAGRTPLFSSGNVGKWYCVESRMRLNDAGQSNGVFQLWIDGELEAQRTDLNWLGSYGTFGINAIFVENFWNDGAPANQSRYFDNFVVSTERIGCGDESSSPPPPAEAGTITISPAGGTLTAIDATLQLAATARSGSGSAVSNPGITWSSSNTAVATVNAQGEVRARGQGTSRISASAACCTTEQVTITVRQDVASLSLSENSLSVPINGTETLVATARDANGHVISGTSPTWSSSNSAVVTVSSSGVVTARSQGTATVRASLSGHTASATITVTGSSPPPTSPPPPASGAWFTWDWNRFSSVDEMIAAAHYCCNGTVTLETGTLPDGSTGKFMRAHLRGNGTEDQTDFDIRLPAGAREIWVEFWLRFDSDWAIRSDDKTFFLYSNAQGNRRWELHYRGNYSYAGAGGNTTEWIVTSSDVRPVRLDVPSRVWDGEWHRHRIYARMSSSPTSSDGALYWWFDDTVLLSGTVGDVWTPSKVGNNVRTGNQVSDYFHSIRLGANADPQGSGVRDWGPIRIWTSNPGW